VPGRRECADPQDADLEHGVVFQEEVVGGEHRRVGRRDGHLVAGVSEGRDRLDVIGVTMRLDDVPDAELSGGFEQQIVLVRGVYQDCVARGFAAHDEDVVRDRTDDEAVDLDLGVAVVEGHGPKGTDRSG